MKLSILVISSVLLVGSFGVAQNQKAESSPSTTRVLNDWVSNVEKLLVPAADAMPEAK